MLTAVNVSLVPVNDCVAEIPPAANTFARVSAGTRFPAASTTETVIVAFSYGA